MNAELVRERGTGVDHMLTHYGSEDSITVYSKEQSTRFFDYFLEPPPHLQNTHKLLAWKNRTGRHPVELGSSSNVFTAKTFIGTNLNWYKKPIRDLGFRKIRPKRYKELTDQIQRGIREYQSIRSNFMATAQRRDDILTEIDTLVQTTRIGLTGISKSLLGKFASAENDLLKVAGQAYKVQNAVQDAYATIEVYEQEAANGWLSAER